MRQGESKSEHRSDDEERGHESDRFVEKEFDKFHIKRAVSVDWFTRSFHAESAPFININRTFLRSQFAISKSGLVLSVETMKSSEKREVGRSYVGDADRVSGGDVDCFILPLSTRLLP